MAVVMERGITRVIPRADRRSWLRWGAAVAVGDVILHTGGGMLINEWEGWANFLGNLSFVVVSGLVIVGLIYGLLVRWGLKGSSGGRNRPVLVALPLAVASVLSYSIFFTWAPLLIAPGAVLLGREGLARAAEGAGARGYAMTATLLGLASLAFGVFLIGYALTHGGDFPFGLF